MSTISKQYDPSVSIIDNRVRFVMAYHGGHIERMKIFLTSPDQEVFQQRIKHDNAWLANALSLNNSLEYLKFCLESGYVKYKIDVHSDNDDFFKTLCYLIKQEPENGVKIEILNYFVFDYKIKQTEAIKHILKGYPEIEKLFSVRDLSNKLVNDLPNKDAHIVKIKI